MYLSRFGVKNYKCLGDIDIPLTPIHVLIGENDAGKTSLLEAIEVFCRCDDSSIDQWFPQPWSDEELVNFRASESEIEFYSQWTPSKNTPVDKDVVPAFECGFSVRFDPLRIQNPQINPLVEKTGQVFKVKPGHLTGKMNQLFFQLEGIGDIKLIHPAKRFVFEPAVMARPAAISALRRFHMDSNGRGLASLLDDILNNDHKSFARLEEMFCQFFPQFSSIKLPPYDIPPGVGRAIKFGTANGNLVRAEQASNGVILILGFLALASLPEPPSLLLIEEPENGIYPKRLEQVINLLKELVAREQGVRFPQIIMTTHSPYLLSYFEPEEVTFLSRPKNDPSGPVRARPLRDAPHIHERMYGGQYYLGELWYNLTEEDLFGAE